MTQAPAGRRLRFTLALLAVLALGLSSRAVHTGLFVVDKSLGDALYASMIILALSVAAPRTSVFLRGGLALGFCFGIEAFKLTGLPQTWAHVRLSRLVFGTTPSVHNLVCYALGVAGALGTEVWLARRLRKP